MTVTRLRNQVAMFERLIEPLNVAQEANESIGNDREGQRMITRLRDQVMVVTKGKVQLMMVKMIR